MKTICIINKCYKIYVYRTLLHCMVLMKTYSLNAYVRFFDGVECFEGFVSFQMIQDFRLARELLCMTNAGTDLAVQIPDVSLDLKILLAIQNRWKDKINMRYFGQPILMLPPKRGATVSLYIVCILTWSHRDFQKIGWLV